jgi:hypothetical protein
VFVHVTDSLVGSGHLRDAAQRPIRVPINYIEHGTSFPDSRGMEIQLTEQDMRVGGIGDDTRVVDACATRHNDVGTSFALKSSGKYGHSGKSGYENRFPSHFVIILLLITFVSSYYEL